MTDLESIKVILLPIFKFKKVEEKISVGKKSKSKKNNSQHTK